MICDIKLTDYRGKTIKNYDVYTNCAHVRIADSDGNVVFNRGNDEPLGDDWLDVKHECIHKALLELDSALLSAIYQ